MKRLLFTADDFGLTTGVSRGIAEAIAGGVVGGTTAMVCGENAEANIRAYADRIPNRIGAHLQLTDGVPRCDPSEVRSLVGDDGRFPRKPALMRVLRPKEVEREWRAQLTVLEGLGITPTHLDSHHHAHRTPGAFHIYRKLAKQLGVSARAAILPEIVSGLRDYGVRCADVFVGHWSDAEPTFERLLQCVRDVDDRVADGGIVEMMCHPGYVDDELRARSTYHEEREQELRVLTSPELPDRLRALGYEVVTIEALRG